MRFQGRWNWTDLSQLPKRYCYYGSATDGWSFSYIGLAWDDVNQVGARCFTGQYNAWLISCESLLNCCLWIDRFFIFCSPLAASSLTHQYMNSLCGGCFTLSLLHSIENFVISGVEVRHLYGTAMSFCIDKVLHGQGHHWVCNYAHTTRYIPTYCLLSLQCTGIFAIFLILFSILCSWSQIIVKK